MSNYHVCLFACLLLLLLYSNTTLHFAAWHNRSDIVELLLANEAVVSDPRTSYTTISHDNSHTPPPPRHVTIDVMVGWYSIASQTAR